MITRVDKLERIKGAYIVLVDELFFVDEFKGHNDLSKDDEHVSDDHVRCVRQGGILQSSRNLCGGDDLILCVLRVKVVSQTDCDQTSNDQQDSRPFDPTDFLGQENSES